MSTPTVRMLIAALCRIAALILVAVLLVELVVIAGYVITYHPYFGDEVFYNLTPSIIGVTGVAAVCAFLWFRAKWIAKWASTASGQFAEATEASPRGVDSQQGDGATETEDDADDSQRTERLFRSAAPLISISLGVLLFSLVFTPFVTSIQIWIGYTRGLIDRPNYEYSAAMLLSALAIGMALFMVLRPVWVARLMFRVIALDQRRIDAKKEAAEADDDEEDEQ